MSVIEPQRIPLTEVIREIERDQIPMTEPAEQFLSSVNPDDYTLDAYNASSTSIRDVKIARLNNNSVRPVGSLIYWRGRVSYMPRQCDQKYTTKGS